jgi:hypothetical protein
VIKLGSALARISHQGAAQFALRTALQVAKQTAQRGRADVGKDKARDSSGAQAYLAVRAPFAGERHCSLASKLHEHPSRAQRRISPQMRVRSRGLVRNAG